MNAIDMLYNGTCLLARSRRRIYVANILIVHFGIELKKYTSIQLEHLTIYPFEKPVRQHHNRDETKILAHKLLV
jgi:hypothetical protein